jgi:predicted ATP-grasp superfamily ATP-dependent carboligase
LFLLARHPPDIWSNEKMMKVVLGRVPPGYFRTPQSQFSGAIVYAAAKGIGVIVAPVAPMILNTSIFAAGPNMRILITGASTLIAPPLIRGFGRRGFEVTAADSAWFSLGKAARHTTRRLRVPVLSRDPKGFLEAILDEVSARRYDLVLPAFEESLLLAEYRREFEHFTRMFLPPFETIWEVHNKPSLYRLSQKLEIPAPPTVIPESRVGLERQVSALQFPVVVKLPTANNCVGRSFCHDFHDLNERYGALYEYERARGAAPPFIQQKIDGDLIYTLMLCDRGRKLGEVIYRPLRTYPEKGGTSAHRESITHPEIATLTAKLAMATEWSGFLGMDFIVGRSDGIPYLIDANPRPTPGVHLGYLAGVDWTGILVDLLEGRDRKPVLARPGVRTRSVMLDVAWLLEGCRPQKQWLSRVRQRFAKFRRPDWNLDDRREFLRNGEWGCAVAQTFLGIGGAMTALLTGRGIGQTILDDVNYDAVAAKRLRVAIQARRLRTIPLPQNSAAPLRKGA